MAVRLIIGVAALVVMFVLWHPTDADPVIETVSTAPSPASASTASTAAPPTTLAPPSPTTTVIPRARTAPTVRAAGIGADTASSVNGYPCGGDLPPCYVLARESGGNPTAQNPRSTASGLWQFLDSTWANFMGYPKARLAPADVQNDKARLVWANGAGCRHWSACR